MRNSGAHASIDYYAYSSAIRGWNSPCKVLFSLAVLVICLAADKPGVSVAAILVCGVLTVGKGGLSLKSYGQLMTIPLTFIVLGTVAIAVNFSTAPAGDYHLNLRWFYLYLTWDGLTMAGFLVLKVFGAVSALFFMTLSTPVHEFLTVLRKAHCPKLLVELMNMIYRFIFILLEVQSGMRISAQARLGFCDFRTSCKSFGGIAANLLFLSLKKANTYYDAMVSRCYTDELLFLEEEHRVTADQLAWLGTGLALLVAVWLLTA